MPRLRLNSGGWRWSKTGTTTQTTVQGCLSDIHSCLKFPLILRGLAISVARMINLSCALAKVCTQLYTAVDQFLKPPRAGDIHIWDRVSAVLLHHVGAQDVGGDLTCIAWNPAAEDPFMFGTGCHDGTVRIWSSPTSHGRAQDEHGSSLQQ